MYDAAVLVVWVSDDVWAKLCLELSPQGQVTVVSVVTRGTSDDCNSVALGRPEVHLRISRLERAYAFHYSQDGVSWKLVRFFALGEKQRAEVGFLAQSPTGDGCTAEFRDIDFAPQKLGDVRSGHCDDTFGSNVHGKDIFTTSDLAQGSTCSIWAAVPCVTAPLAARKVPARRSMGFPVLASR